MATVDDVFDRMIRLAHHLDAQATALRVALRQYGDHYRTCPAHGYAALRRHPTTDAMCDCGWAEIRRHMLDPYDASDIGPS